MSNFVALPLLFYIIILLFVIVKTGVSLIFEVKILRSEIIKIEIIIINNV